VPAVERVEHGNAVGACDHRLAVQCERLRAQLGGYRSDGGIRSVQSWPRRVNRRTGQAVEPSHHQDVAGLEPLDHSGELGPVAARAARLLGKYLGAPRDLQLGHLAGQVCSRVLTRTYPRSMASLSFAARYMRQ
jgi:hypothetical protein